MPEADAVKKDRLALLHECGPQTPMGRLLRSFWQPVALSGRVAPGEARAVSILDETLTLYRGASGAAHLIGGRCAHRCTVLHTGWVEGEQIRCMYHGWRYDAEGRCTEMPAEREVLPGARVAGYPVQEYGGLVFAYLGDGPAPPFALPRKPQLEVPGKQIVAREQIWDCNWFQQVENSLDAVHVSFVHQWGSVSRFGSEVSREIPELTYEETPAGIRQIARRSADNVRISDWTFPNNNHIVSAAFGKDDPWYHVGVWAVPIDERRTARFFIMALDPETETARLHGTDPRPDFTPADYHGELFDEHCIPAEALPIGLTQTQDYVALRGQGTIVDRREEHLGRSDAGIALLRRIFLRELDALREGRATKAWHHLAEAPAMPQPGQRVAV